MAGLSRRDGLYESLNGVRDILEQVQQQQQQQQQQRSPGSSHDAGRQQQQPATGSASSTSPPTSSRTANNGGNNQKQLAEYLQRMGSNFQNALQGSPLNGATGTRRNPYACLGPIDPSSSQPPASIDATATGDDLPDYAPRSDSIGQAIKYRHSLTSSSKKIEVILESVGTKTHPVYVENLCPTIRGVVRLKIGGDDTVNELRIRMKGVVTTTIKRVQASTRGLGEEEEFWYASSLLWTATEAQPTLDLKKEMHEFPFSLDIPTTVPTGPRIRKHYAMPPSFVLSAPYTDPSPVESASIRYYLKVTLARKGLLKQNDRLFAPCVYLNRASDLSWLTDARRAWLVQQIPLPSPLQAPNDWQGRVEAKELRKGFLARKHFNFNIAILLPKPLIFGKIEQVPFYISMTSAQSSMLDQFGPTSLYVGLLQRTVVFCHGTPAVHETAVAKASLEPANEPSDSPDPSMSTKRFKGILQLNKSPSTSFKSYNIEVTYFVLVNLVNPSTGAGVETLATLPITVLSIPPVSRNAVEVQRSSAAARAQNAVGGGQAQVVQEEVDVPDLPPNYFDVVEPERRQ